MCLYPVYIKNRKYQANKKNGGNVPTCYDERLKMVPVPCGHCSECLAKKAREWQIRLWEEFKADTDAYFCTFTFSDESIKDITKQLPTEAATAVATLAMRRFLERWRKKYKKSIKHWFTTELGHTGTHRLHLHGIIWTKQDAKEIERIWKYGFVHIEKLKGQAGIQYITKYITKTDLDHKGFTPIILCSKGLGEVYLKKGKLINQFQGYERETNRTYQCSNGTLIILPKYYQNKLYNEDIREYFWLQTLDKNESYVNGNKYVTNSPEHLNALALAKKRNKENGFGDNHWVRKIYNATLVSKFKYQKMQKQTLQSLDKKEIERFGVEKAYRRKLSKIKNEYINQL